MIRPGALAALLFFAPATVFAQPTSSASTGFPRVIRVSGALDEPTDAAPTIETVTFAIYAEPSGGTPLIASVPYALRAADADTLGGRPASDCALAEQITLQGAAPATPANAGRIRGPSLASRRYSTSTADYLQVTFNDPFGAFTGIAVLERLLGARTETATGKP